MQNAVFFPLLKIYNLLRGLMLGVEENPNMLVGHLRALKAEDEGLCRDVFSTLLEFDKNPSRALQKFRDVHIPGTEKTVGDFLTPREALRRIGALPTDGAG